MMQNRYSRQILFQDIGEKGQRKINEKTVLIVGMGALGTHLAEGLVRAGIKKLRLIDRDYIEASNLQRQTLFNEADANEATPKVVAAERALKKIRSDVIIESVINHADVHVLNELVEDVDLIMDATDNFDTRMMINDVAYKNQIPWIYGGVVRSTYVEAPFIPGQTPCFQCLIPQIPSMNLTCDTVGVIQPAVTMTTSFQLRDALKILTETPFTPKLTYGDIWEGTHHTFGFRKLHRQECPTCGAHPSFPFLVQQQPQMATLCGRDTVQYLHPEVHFEDLITFLDKHRIAYKSNGYIVQFMFQNHRIVGFQNGRLLIHGMTDVNQSYTIINQLFG
ncbi:ThiF family adenylyltransferase [Staphylococcus chromogenes]|uniref:ThiF family adenylyltransferase n=1 Tax=Staphylococcus chromogenes TaxID=46126 RepID=UPI002888E358|nr:ThiF family adenylyltransferase [Staphylococcus chromogenes]MDT0741011.1 ThiF family adenylyltransferase [Staphylococcus chromogenes]